jgi:hypothetical protein
MIPSSVSLTVGKVDAGVTVLLTQDKRLIEFPSILLPPNISSGSIVDIAVSRNLASEAATARSFAGLQDRILQAFGASEPSVPVLRCRNATQTSVVLEWDPIRLATSELLGLSLYRNGQKAGSIPRPLAMQSTKISGLAVDTEYAFHLVLRTTAGTYISEKVPVRTHKMTDLSGVTVTTGIMPSATREALTKAIARIGAKMAEDVRIDTTHFVTTEGRGLAWERAMEMNIPVVRPEWVEACERSGRILGVTKFYLDAVRPGAGGGSAAQTAPSIEETRASSTKTDATSPPPTAVQKDIPERPAEKERPSTPDGQEGAEAIDNDGDGDGNKERRNSDAEQKVLSPGPKDKSKKGVVESEGEEEDPRGKALASPDGASFQDVAL